MKIFISGSIKIKNINKLVTSRIDNIISSNYDVIIGDADGVDSAIQKILFDKTFKNVTVYYVGDKPRNNIGSWPSVRVETNYKKNTRKYYMAKDLKMAEECDYGFMIWDSRSTGTLSNIYELLIRGKKSLVFVNKSKKFYTIQDASSFEYILSVMHQNSFLKANQKIDLTKKIKLLKNKQLTLFGANNALQPTAIPLAFHSGG